MAKDDLVGNMATEVMIEALEGEGFDLQLNKAELVEAMKIANSVFD